MANAVQAAPGPQCQAIALPCQLSHVAIPLQHHDLAHACAHSLGPHAGLVSLVDLLDLLGCLAFTFIPVQGPSSSSSAHRAQRSCGLPIHWHLRLPSLLKSWQPTTNLSQKDRASSGIIHWYVYALSLCSEGVMHQVVACTQQAMFCMVRCFLSPCTAHVSTWWKQPAHAAPHKATAAAHYWTGRCCIKP